MTKRETGTLVFKVFSLYVMYNAIIQFAYWAWPLIWRSREMPGLTDQWIFASAVVTSVLHFVFGIVIWWTADRLAGYLAPGKETAASLTALSVSDLQALAFSVVGLLVVVRAIPGLVETGFPYVAPHVLRESLYARPVPYDRLAGRVVELAIGLVLIFYSQGVISVRRSISKRAKEK